MSSCWCTSACSRCREAWPRRSRRFGRCGMHARGWVDHREALAWVSRCDVGLVPHHATESWQTTIPNKLFDYMSLGKPVIVSNARPTARIVTEERCGIVFKDRDANALAEAIVALGDPSVREKCASRGREAVR